MIRIFMDHICRIENYLAAGGMVMLPLMVVSALMWTLIINRLLFFRRLYRKNMTRKTASEYLKSGESPDTGKYRGATVMLVNRFLQRRSGRTDLDRFILDETVVVIVSSLDRYLALIGILAALAPLLGLLGTVTGMIATFDIISFFGTGNARAMARGISEALITTQTGLIVAIPGLYLSNFLNRRAENLKQRIASVGIYLRQHV
jgi:biopolymer transport protein ExbB